MSGEAHHYANRARTRQHRHGHGSEGNVFLCVGFVTLLWRHSIAASKHTPRCIGNDQATCDLQYWKRDTEEVEDETSKKHERNQDKKYIEARLHGGAMAVLPRKSRGDGKKQRDPPKRIHDRKQREVCRCSSSGNCQQQMLKGIGRSHHVVTSQSS